MVDRSGDLLTESDSGVGGGDIGGAPISREQAPPGLSNLGDMGGGSQFDLPQPSQRGAPGGSQQPAQQFDIVETDSQFRPLQQPQQPGQQLRPDEGEHQAPDGGDPEQPQGHDRQFRQNRTGAERRRMQNRARDRLYAENARLQAQVDELVQWRQQFEPQINDRFGQFDQARVQGELSELERQIGESAQRAQVARRTLAEAMQNQDPDAFTRALEERDAAVIAGQQLLARKNMLTASAGRAAPAAADARAQFAPQQGQPPAQPQAPAPRPMPAAMRRNIEDFAARHDWFTGDRNDLDNRIVLEIDRHVAEQGFDPNSPEYWDEVEDLMRDRLPHRFQDQRQSAQPRQQQPRQPAPPPERRGPMVGGQGDRAQAPAARNQVYLSPERKQSMIEAGILEQDGRSVRNPDRFNRVLARYAEFDRANGVVR